MKVGKSGPAGAAPSREVCNKLVVIFALACAWIVGVPNAMAAVCDLQITSETGFSGATPTDMRFTFCNTGPEACTGTTVRMPVNFPGTTQSTFSAHYYNVTSVNATGWNDPPFPQPPTCNFAGDQVTCSSTTFGVDQCRTIEIYGAPVPNPTNEGCVSAYHNPGAGNSDPDASDNPHRSCYPIGQQNIVVRKDRLGPPGGVTQGGEVPFHITITNQALVPLSTPFIDTPPAGLTYLRVENGPGITCAISGGNVLCNRTGGWQPGETTFTLVFRADLPGQLTNQCTMNPPAPWSVDDSACSATVNIGSPGTATKTGPGSATIGEEFDWIINVNLSPPAGAASAYWIEDTIPAGFDIVSAAITGFNGSCTISGQNVSCNAIFDILHSCSGGCAGTVTIRVIPTTSGSHTNYCTVSTDGTTFVQPQQCQHTIIVEQAQEADIEATKSATTGIFWPGQPITYTVTVTNHGPDDAAQVEVLDALPFTSNTWTVNAPGASSCDTITPTSTFFRCWYPYLGVGQSVSLTLTGTVPAGYAQPTLLNRCQAGPSTLSSPQFVDPNSKNNAYNHCRAETPRGTPHVSVAKTAPGTAPLGDEFNYVLTAQNGSPVAISGVQVVDNLPAGVSFVSASANAYFTCSHAAGVVTCDAASMPPNAVAQITIRVRAEQPGQVTNTCQASFGGGTVDVSNCTTTTQVTPGTVTVSKADSADPVWVQEQFTYNIRVRNTSGARADNVVVSDTLPSGLVFHSVGSPAPFTCTNTGLSVSCSAAQVQAGTDVTIPIVVHGTAPGTVTNTCSATVGGVPVSGVCQEPTTIRNGLVEVVKTDTQDPVLLGQTFDYILSVSNTSGGPALNVQVSDPVPYDLEVLSFNPAAPFTCQTVGTSNNVVCSAANIPAGYSGQIVITVRAMIVGTVWNYCGAEVSGIPMTQQDCEESTIVEAIAFDVVKSDSADPVYVGDQFSYYLDWTYEESHVLPFATITDTLPSNVTFVSSASDNPAVNCSTTIIPGFIECNFVNVPGNSSGRIEIVVTAPGNAVSIENNCLVSVMATDGYPVSDCYEPTLVLPKVTVEKSDLVDPVYVGETITYQITLTNEHNEAAERLSVTDGLPHNATLLTYSGANGWTCTQPTSDVVECQGDIPASSSITLTLEMEAPATAQTVVNSCDAFVNMKVLASDGGSDRASFQPIPLPSDNCNEETTVLATQADLSAIKTGPSTPVLLGQPFDYIIAVTNAGPNDALNAVVTDTLPPGTTFVAANGMGWTCSHDGGLPGVVTCNAPTVAVGPADPITVRVIAPAVPGTIENVCQVSSDTADPVTNPACAVSTVVREALPVTAAKVDAADPVLIGQNIHYSITVTNTDPEFAAEDITVIDHLPAGSVYVDASGSGWSCVFDGGSPGSVSCSTASLTPLEVSTINVEIQPSASAGDIVNTCTVEVDDPLWPVDSTACNETTTVREADGLVVTKTDLVDPVRTGQSVNYQITVTNTDTEAEATNISVTDTLPAGTVYQAASAAAGSCAHDGNVPGAVSCSFAGLAAGGTATIDVTISAPSTVGVILNTCSASAAYPGPVDYSGCTEETTVIESGDLVVSKVDLVDPVQAGEVVTYRIDVTNTDDSEAASNIGVIDALPVGTTFISAQSASGTCSHDGGSPGSVSCSIASLGAGDVASIEITVSSPESPGTITNTCTATATFVGSVDSSACTEDTVIVRAGDIIVIKSDMADPVAAGSDVVYMITVENTDSSSAATNVVVVDTLPAGTVFQSATVNGGSCAHDGGEPGVVTCQIASIGAGSTGTVNLVVRAPLAAGTISNVCTATATTSGTVNDAGCEEDTTITSTGALVATKMDAVDPVQVGESIRYLITVANTSAGDEATDVVVTDLLPANTTFEAAVVPGGSCSHDGGTPGSVVCEIASIAAGSLATITVDVQAIEMGQVVNTCSVVATFSGAIDDAGCTEPTTVLAGGEASLTLDKVASPRVAAIGDLVTWTITVTNSGDADAEDVVITDDVPVALSVQSATASQGACVIMDQMVQCDVGTVPAGGSATATVVTRAVTRGPTENLCVVTSSTQTRPNSSRCGGTVIIGEEPEIIVSKSTSHSTVMMGGRFTWTVHVSNTGPGQAQNVEVTDAMPAGVEVLDAPANCVFNDPDFVCGLGSLASGESTTLDFVVRAHRPGNYQNLCVVSYADSTGALTDVSQGCESTTVVTGSDSVRAVPFNDPRALFLMILLMVGMVAFVHRR